MTPQAHRPRVHPCHCPECWATRTVNRAAWVLLAFCLLYVAAQVVRAAVAAIH